MKSHTHPDRRKLGPVSASAIVVSNMVGTGIFTTTGFILALGLSPGDTLLVWILGGILASIGALIYGELGMAYPYSGGEYTYLSRILHPLAGFLSGWVSLIAGFAAPVAAAAMAMHLYMARVIPQWPVKTASILTVLLFGYLHTRKLQWGSSIQVGLTILKVVLLLGFILVIFFRPLQPADSGWLTLDPQTWMTSQFAVALIFVSFAYSGWNASAYIGEEIRNPRRNLPLSLISGTLIVTVLYTLTNLTFLRAVPSTTISGKAEVAHEVALKVLGKGGADGVSLLIALGLTATVSAMVMVGPRVLEAMARDGVFPRYFARLNHYQVPERAIWLQTGISIVMIITAAFEPLLIYIGYTLNLFTALTAIALFVHRRRQPSSPRIFVGYPVFPLIFIAFAGWMTIWSIQSRPLSTLSGLATLLVGYFVYLYLKKHASPSRSNIPS